MMGRLNKYLQGPEDFGPFVGLRNVFFLYLLLGLVLFFLFGCGAKRFSRISGFHDDRSVSYLQTVTGAKLRLNAVTVEASSGTYFDGSKAAPLAGAAAALTWEPFQVSAGVDSVFWLDGSGAETFFFGSTEVAW
jgi:hypothetical protein